jgi:hypothetical protein
MDYVPTNYPFALDAILHTGDLLDKGKLEWAYRYIYSFRESHADLDVFVDSTVINCELLTGRYDAAYTECLTYIKANTGPRKWIGEYTYLQLALAAAGRGQVFDGQEEYCANWFKRHYSESWSDDKVDLSLSVGEPRKAMILATLALAVQSSATQAYFESILKLDPKNDLAGKILVQYDNWQGRYSDLRRVASLMVTHVTEEASLKFYQDQIAKVEGRADRPKFRPKRVQSVIAP